MTGHTEFLAAILIWPGSEHPVPEVGERGV